jgi:hypothetical protein
MAPRTIRANTIPMNNLFFIFAVLSFAELRNSKQ